MKKLVKKLLIFDIDATLLLSGGIGKEAFNRALCDVFGAERDWWAGTKAHGKTDPQLIKEISERERGYVASADEMASVAERYFDYFESGIAAAPNFRLMPGVQELIPLLAEQSEFALGIGTGNFARTAEMKLRRGGLAQYFSYGGYACDSEFRPELIRRAIERGSELYDAEQVTVIGDAPQDIEASLANGAFAVGVATGAATCAELLAAGANSVLEDLSDLPSVLKLLRD